MMRMILASVFLYALIATSFAEENKKASYKDSQTITSVTVVEVESFAPTFELPDLNLGEIASQSSQVIAAIDGMVAVGQKIWKLVEAGRSVVNIKFAPMVSVLPKLDEASGTLYQMANWSPPIVKSYRVAFNNKFNSEVAAFTYTLYFQYNGSYKGQGKYITNLKVQAGEINMGWGFNLDSTSELVGISNVGTVENPTASAMMQIAYTVKGPLNESRSQQSFYVDGAGNVQVIH